MATASSSSRSSDVAEVQAVPPGGELRCLICADRFDDVSALEGHVAVYHFGFVRFKCSTPTCHFVAPSRAFVVQHAIDRQHRTDEIIDEAERDPFVAKMVAYIVALCQNATSGVELARRQVESALKVCIRSSTKLGRRSRNGFHVSDVEEFPPMLTRSKTTMTTTGDVASLKCHVCEAFAYECCDVPLSEHEAHVSQHIGLFEQAIAEQAPRLAHVEQMTLMWDRCFGSAAPVKRLWASATPTTTSPPKRQRTGPTSLAKAIASNRSTDRTAKRQKRLSPASRNVEVLTSSSEAGPNTLRCRQCDFKFNTGNVRASTTYHVWRYHCSTKPIKCGYCSHRVCTMPDMKMHLRSRHHGMPDKQETPNAQQREEFKRQAELCGFKGKTWNMRYDGYDCTRTSPSLLSVTPAETSATVDAPEDASCGTAAREQQQRGCHLKNLQIKCVRCGSMVIKFGGYLKAHVRQAHFDKDVFSCSLCAYGVRNRASFVRKHILEHHGLRAENAHVVDRSNEFTTQLQGLLGECFPQFRNSKSSIDEALLKRKRRKLGGRSAPRSAKPLASTKAPSSFSQSSKMTSRSIVLDKPTPASAASTCTDTVQASVDPLGQCDVEQPLANVAAHIECSTVADRPSVIRSTTTAGLASSLASRETTSFAGDTTETKHPACAMCGKLCDVRSQQSHVFYHVEQRSGSSRYQCGFCGRGMSHLGDIQTHLVSSKSHPPATTFVDNTTKLDALYTSVWRECFPRLQIGALSATSNARVHSATAACDSSVIDDPFTSQSTANFECSSSTTNAKVVVQQVVDTSLESVPELIDVSGDDDEGFMNYVDKLFG